MGKLSRRKGAGYELEVCAEIFEQLGLRVQRKLGQARDSGNDIDLPMHVGRLRLECKRRSRIGVGDWLDQVKASCAAGDMPAVVMRADGWGESVVVIELKDFLRLIREELEFTTGGGE